jgi:GT2 family glycosyltransferase
LAEEAEQGPLSISRKMTDVSVVVCSYRRTTDLLDCLNSLEAQDYPPHKRETIVVTNPDDTATINLVRDHFPSTTLAIVERKGVVAARNKGIEVAASPVVAFIDDDAVASESWLSKILEAYAGDKLIAGVGGKILLRTRFRIPAHISKYASYLGWYDKGDLRRPVKNFFGCNMSFRREVLLSLNGFDESYSRLFGKLMVGEETELAMRIRARNLQIMYEPAAIVFHKVSEERLTWGYIVERSFWQGISEERMNPKGRWWRRLRRIARLSILAPWRYPLDTAVEVAYDTGRLKESLRRSSRPPP